MISYAIFIIIAILSLSFFLSKKVAHIINLAFVIEQLLALFLLNQDQLVLGTCLSILSVVTTIVAVIVAIRIQDITEIRKNKLTPLKIINTFIALILFAVPTLIASRRLLDLNMISRIEGSIADINLIESKPVLALIPIFMMVIYLCGVEMLQHEAEKL